MFKFDISFNVGKVQGMEYLASIVFITQCLKLPLSSRHPQSRLAAVHLNKLGFIQDDFFPFIHLQHPQVNSGHACLPARALEELDVREPDADVALEPVLQDLEELVDAHSDPTLDLRLLVLIPCTFSSHG